jgi:hypothetical protein
MDESQHPIGGESYMVFCCPLDIGTAFRQIGRKHCTEIIDFPASGTFYKPLGIYRTLLGFGIKVLTPRIQVNNQYMAIDRLFMTTKPAF